MTDKRTLQFVDTNVLVYAHDASTAEKHERAQRLLNNLWESRAGCLSIQVLQEFYVTVTRKVTTPLTPEQASRIIGTFDVWRVHQPATQDIQSAIVLQVRYDVSFWDAMILHSAAQLGCDTLWSEDLNAEQIYGNVRVRNPLIE
ncbi:MAG: PIN domain-containing protein [Caldilineaceae bacterium]|nr:PIN domain-containing protein [Caldilineaceae bacterium]MCB0098782.1 PIN domain-containing protein [Caldilineaceae bacterium]MCB0145253.1 PIN domain-containing protein [Caldilineaceae bacterium]